MTSERECMDGFDDSIIGWELSVTMQLGTPLQWLQRHREFHEGPERPQETLPPEHARWLPIRRASRQRGADTDAPATMMASEAGPIPVDGGDFLPFLLEYRMIVEDGGGTFVDLASRYPQYRDLVVARPLLVRRRKAGK